MPQRQPHREMFFAANGMGPYNCFGCNNPMPFESDFVVHHVDHNPDNNASDNLVGMHAGCHVRLHKTGWRHSADTRARLRVLNRRTPSKEQIVELSAARQRKGYPPETREKMRLAKLGKPMPQATRDKISAALKRKKSWHSAASLVV